MQIYKERVNLTGNWVRAYSSFVQAEASKQASNTSRKF